MQGLFSISEDHGHDKWLILIPMKENKRSKQMLLTLHLILRIPGMRMASKCRRKW